MKLKRGDRIKVHGFVMLEGLDEGNIYSVVATEPYYIFQQRKKRIGHKVALVDMSIDDRDFNRIEILTNKS